MRTDDLYSLPENLPVPEDDGACDHLRGSMLPSIGLRATSRLMVDLSKEGRPWLVVYCYPRTGRPDEEPPGGIAAWNAIPGARGCTPQSCAYRDQYTELTALGAALYGLSTQDTEYQTEAVQRLHLPFPLLSDPRLGAANLYSRRPRAHQASHGDCPSLPDRRGVLSCLPVRCGREARD